MHASCASELMLQCIKTKIEVKIQADMCLKYVDKAILCYYDYK